MYSCHAVVTRTGLLCLSSAMRMREFVDIIAARNGHGRIHHSRNKLTCQERSTFDIVSLQSFD